MYFHLHLNIKTLYLCIKILEVKKDCLLFKEKTCTLDIFTENTYRQGEFFRNFEQYKHF